MAYGIRITNLHYFLQAYGIVEGAGGASPLMFALLFGLVGGIMVAIAFLEVLPKAFL